MADTVEFDLVSPAKLMMSEPVSMVVIPGGEGDFGVLPGHTPILSTVRPGTINIYDDKGVVTESIFVAGGFAEVTGERVTVLAEEAVPVKELTTAAAEERLRKANEALVAAEKDDDRADAERELLAAEAMQAALGSA